MLYSSLLFSSVYTCTYIERKQTNGNLVIQLAGHYTLPPLRKCRLKKSQRSVHCTYLLINNRSIIFPINRPPTRILSLLFHLNSGKIDLREIILLNHFFVCLFALLIQGEMNFRLGTRRRTSFFTQKGGGIYLLPVFKYTKDLDEKRKYINSNF